MAKKKVKKKKKAAKKVAKKKTVKKKTVKKTLKKNGAPENKMMASRETKVESAEEMFEDVVTPSEEDFEEANDTGKIEVNEPIQTEDY